MLGGDGYSGRVEYWPSTAGTAACNVARQAASSPSKHGSRRSVTCCPYSVSLASTMWGSGPSDHPDEEFPRITLQTSHAPSLLRHAISVPQPRTVRSDGCAEQSYSVPREHRIFRPMGRSLSVSCCQTRDLGLYCNFPVPAIHRKLRLFACQTGTFRGLPTQYRATLPGQRQGPCQTSTSSQRPSAGHQYGQIRWLILGSNTPEGQHAFHSSLAQATSKTRSKLQHCPRSKAPYKNRQP